MERGRKLKKRGREERGIKREINGERKREGGSERVYGLVCVHGYHTLMASQLDPGTLPALGPLHHGQEGPPGSTLQRSRESIGVNVREQRSQVKREQTLCS